MAAPTTADLREASDDGARVLERACQVYLGLLAHLGEEGLPARVREPVLVLLRDVAFVRRLAEELASAYEREQGEVEYLDDPRLPLDLLGRLSDSLLLLATATSSAAASEEPLVAPEDVDRDLEGLEAWLALRRPADAGQAG